MRCVLAPSCFRRQGHERGPAGLEGRQGLPPVLGGTAVCGKVPTAPSSQRLLPLGLALARAFWGWVGQKAMFKGEKGVMRIHLLSCFKETFLLLHALTIATPATYLGSNDQLTSLPCLQMIPARFAGVLLALALILPGRYQRASISHSCPRAIWSDPFLGLSRCVWSSPVCLAPT